MYRASDGLTVDGDPDPDGWPLVILYDPIPLEATRGEPLYRVIILPERYDFGSLVEERCCIDRISAFAVAILDLIVTAGQHLNELDIGEWWLGQWMFQAPPVLFPR